MGPGLGSDISEFTGSVQETKVPPPSLPPTLPDHQTAQGLHYDSLTKHSHLRRSSPLMRDKAVSMVTLHSEG